MKVTKQYCDLCRGEYAQLYAIDIEIPLELRTKGKIWPHPIGRYTLDGMWEIEVCCKCMEKTMVKMEDILCQS